MKNKIYVITAFIVLFVLNLYAIDEYCIIKSHPFDMLKAKKEINEICLKGYVPVGMELQANNVITILYIKDTFLSFTQWQITEVPNTKKVNDYFLTFMKDNWLPVGMTIGTDSIYFLILKTKYKNSGIQIIKSDFKPKVMEEVLKTSIEQGYYPFDISFTKDTIWFLVEKVEDFKTKDVVLKGFVNDLVVIRKGVEEQIKLGFRPWGFMAGPDGVYIMFAKF